MLTVFDFWEDCPSTLFLRLRWRAKCGFTLKVPCLCKEGEKANEILALYEGEADVWTTHAKQKEWVSTVGPCDVIGELAFLTEGPRAATVEVSSGQCLVLAIPVESVRGLVQNDPQASNSMLSTMAYRMQTMLTTKVVDTSAVLDGFQ